MDRDKAARLLDMLRMRTEARGATPAEAAQAAELAAKIIQRYGLDDTCGKRPTQSALECGQKKRAAWIITLASAIGRRFDLNAELATCTGRNAIVRFIGPEHRVNVALWLFRAIEKDMRRMVSAECSRRGLKGGRLVRFRNQYFDSFTLTIWARLDPRSPEQIEADAKRIRDQLQEHPRQQPTRALKRFSQMDDLDWQASRAGGAAAESISLSTSVISGDKAAPMLIGGPLA